MNADNFTSMIAAGLALWLTLKPLDFPERPLPAEVHRGYEIYTQRKGLDRLYLDDRQAVGYWFDGSRRRDADHVVWLSPSLAARWLGFLEAKEKWPPEELLGRWAKLRACLSGKLTFVVRLCAMPKIDFLDQEAGSRPTDRDALDVRFLWTASNPDWPVGIPNNGWPEWVRSRYKVGDERPQKSIQASPHACLLEERRRRSAGEVLTENWWRRVPFGEVLTPEFDREPMDNGLPLGDFLAATYIVQLALPEAPLPEGGFELRIFSPSKERIARFSLVPNRR